MNDRKLIAAVGIAALFASGLLAGHWLRRPLARDVGEGLVAGGSAGSFEPAAARTADEARATVTQRSAMSTAATQEVGAAGSGPDQTAPASDPTRPIISAIRADHASLADKRTAMVSAVEASGLVVPQDAVWAARASEVFGAWEEQMPASALTGIVRGEPRCFQAGCAVDVEFQSEAAYNEAARAFRSISEPGVLHGGRVQTPAVPTERGRVVATWIMLQPSVLAHAPNPG